MTSKMVQRVEMGWIPGLFYNTGHGHLSWTCMPRRAGWARNHNAGSVRRRADGCIGLGIRWINTRQAATALISDIAGLKITRVLRSSPSPQARSRTMTSMQAWEAAMMRPC